MSEVGPTDQVRDTWESLAPAWERHRKRVFEAFRPVSDWLVEQIHPQPGQTVAEIAAGPGETGFLVAARLGPTGRLISTDVAPGMVEVARRGAEAQGLANVECRVMDAQQMDLPDASVDGMISRLGLMLTPDPALVFSEARRVLRPDGRLAYAVIGRPDRNPWMGLMMMALVARGHSPLGDPFGPAGPFSLSAPDRNRELLAGAGFESVEAEELDGVMRFADPDDYFAFQSAVGGPVPALIASLPDEEADAVRASLEPMLSPFKAGDEYEVPSHLVGVTAW